MGRDRDLIIGLLGCGTVGTGVYEILRDQKENLEKLYGEAIEIKKVLVKDIAKKRNLDNPCELITTDVKEILDDSSIEMIVEVMGGVEEAYDYICYALRKGKHVVTANKAVVANYMEELLSLAETNNVTFLFEASVGGGIPLLKPLRQCSLLNKFTEIKGILNGTSNFILTKMVDEDLEFNEALEMAQQLGYAEADSTDDIEGTDVARKLAILSTVAFKESIPLENVICRGIRGITKKDIKKIKDLGYSVKLLGKSVTDGERFSAIVEPVLFKKSSQFEKVSNAFNMVSVKGDQLEELRFYGEGAGKKATANAVVCDILDILSKHYPNVEGYSKKRLKASSDRLIKGKYYLRISSAPHLRDEIINEIFSIGNIKAQRLVKTDDYIVITEKVEANKVTAIVQELNKLDLNIFLGRLEEE